MTEVKKESGKAADTKDTQVVVGTNPLLIPWPQDQQGMLASLKKGGIEAAKRVNGDEEKLKRLLTALQLIEAHAKAKYKADAESRQKAKVNAVSAHIRVQEKLARQAEAKATQFEAAAADIRIKAGIVGKGDE
jgi:ABC-type taurine transport system ATPase subunit